MSGPQDCLRCGGRMSAGFIVDQGYGIVTVGDWVEGLPEHSIWTGLKLRGKRRLPVTTHRCDQCGRLESYAAAS